MTPPKGITLVVGTVVRDRIWGGTHTGTGVRAEARRVFVARHDSFVEDELDDHQVEIWAKAPNGCATGAARSGSSDRMGPAGSAASTNPAHDLPTGVGRPACNRQPVDVSSRRRNPPEGGAMHGVAIYAREAGDVFDLGAVQRRGGRTFTVCDDLGLRRRARTDVRPTCAGGPLSSMRPWMVSRTSSREDDQPPEMTGLLVESPGQGLSTGRLGAELSGVASVPLSLPGRNLSA